MSIQKMFFILIISVVFLSGCFSVRSNWEFSKEGTVIASNKIDLKTTAQFLNNSLASTSDATVKNNILKALEIIDKNEHELCKIISSNNINSCSYKDYILEYKIINITSYVVTKEEVFPYNNYVSTIKGIPLSKLVSINDTTINITNTYMSIGKQQLKRFGAEITIFITVPGEIIRAEGAESTENNIAKFNMLDYDFEKEIIINSRELNLAYINILIALAILFFIIFIVIKIKSRKNNSFQQNTGKNKFENELKILEEQRKKWIEDEITKKDSITDPRNINK